MTDRGKILAVADDPRNLEIFKFLLEDKYLLDFARTKEEALKKTLSFNPDLVLLDMDVMIFKMSKIFRIPKIVRMPKIARIPKVSKIPKTPKRPTIPLMSPPTSMQSNICTTPPTTPKTSAHELCRLIKESSENRTKVILVSEKNRTKQRTEQRTEERRLSDEAGADDYITLPIDEEEFLTKIKILLKLL